MQSLHRVHLDTCACSVFFVFLLSGHVCFPLSLCVCMNNAECDAKTQTPIHTHTQTHLSLVLKITLFLTTREWNLSPLCMLFVNMSNGKEKKTFCGFTIKLKITVQIFFGTRKEKKKDLSG